MEGCPKHVRIHLLEQQLLRGANRAAGGANRAPLGANRAPWDATRAPSFF